MAKKAKAKHKLSMKMEAFCQLRAAGNNATKSAEGAGYSKKTAKSKGHDLLTKVYIQERITEIQKPAVELNKITVERVFKELADIAFCDIGEMYDENGIMLAIPDMPESVRRSIASVGMGRDTIGSKALKIKLHNKATALELLGKTNILSMFTENIKAVIEEAPASKEAFEIAKKELAKDIAKELKK